MPQLVLSLFPGIDLLGRAFEEVWVDGICVVRGPDVIFGGDIRGWHVPAGKFDGVIGGPPCQAFSELVKLVKHNGHSPKFGNLIPEFCRCIEEGHPPSTA
jgi:DNA (cytosine-5)-methyltransferase 1